MRSVILAEFHRAQMMQSTPNKRTKKSVPLVCISRYERRQEGSRYGMESQSINPPLLVHRLRPCSLISLLLLNDTIHHLALPPLRLGLASAGWAGFMVGRAFLAQAGGGGGCSFGCSFFARLPRSFTWRPDMTGPALEGQCPQSQRNKMSTITRADHPAATTTSSLLMQLKKYKQLFRTGTKLQGYQRLLQLIHGNC